MNIDLPLNYRNYGSEDYALVASLAERNGLYNLANFIANIGDELKIAKDLEWKLDDALALVEQHERDETRAKNERDRILDFIHKTKGEKDYSKKDALGDIEKLLDRMF